jgi:hypothetical protein
VPGRGGAGLVPSGPPRARGRSSARRRPKPCVRRARRRHLPPAPLPQAYEALTSRRNEYDRLLEELGPAGAPAAAAGDNDADDPSAPLTLRHACKQCGGAHEWRVHFDVAHRWCAPCGAWHRVAGGDFWAHDAGSAFGERRVALFALRLGE